MSGAGDAYGNALAKVALSADVLQRLIDNQVRVAWTSGYTVADMCRLTGLGITEAMDRVRALGLPDRCPATRQLLQPLTGEQQAH